MKDSKEKEERLELCNHRPVILITAKTAKRPSTSNAALNIRMSCVRGSTNCHIKAQITATNDIRKMKENKLLNINLEYPILT